MLPLAESVQKAEQAMLICNACRYCEGYCAVFPAIERRRTFSYHDLIYLASLCHDCRGCYYACQYAPPHEFDVNIPKIFQEIRAKTYMDYVWPRFMAGIFRRNGILTALLIAIIVIIIAMLVPFQSDSTASSLHDRGAFYRVIPYALMTFPALAISFLSFAAILLAMVRFWQDTGGKLGKALPIGLLPRAIAAILELKHLKGGGHGCNYPDESFTHVRRWFHHLTFYGFMFCFASTLCAAYYENLLNRIPPYPCWSLPVILGTIGGVALLIGSAGLFILKLRSDKAPASSSLIGMDLAFSMSLFLTSLSGLLLLALRETHAMGILLMVHFGLVLCIFLSLPYGKFVHAVYRCCAIVQDTIEQSRESRQH